MLVERDLTYAGRPKAIQRNRSVWAMAVACSGRESLISSGLRNEYSVNLVWGTTGIASGVWGGEESECHYELAWAWAWISSFVDGWGGVDHQRHGEGGEERLDSNHFEGCYEVRMWVGWWFSGIAEVLIECWMIWINGWNNVSLYTSLFGGRQVLLMVSSS
jgi:hypothetical protein